MATSSRLASPTASGDEQPDRRAAAGVAGWGSPCGTSWDSPTRACSRGVYDPEQDRPVATRVDDGDEARNVPGRRRRLLCSMADSSMDHQLGPSPRPVAARLTPWSLVDRVETRRVVALREKRARLRLGAPEGGALVRLLGPTAWEAGTPPLRPGAARFAALPARLAQDPEG